MVNAMCGLNEIGIFRVVDIQKLLRIPVDKRKPGILDLHHDAVSLSECMAHVGVD